MVAARCVCCCLLTYYVLLLVVPTAGCGRCCLGIALLLLVPTACWSCSALLPLALRFTGASGYWPLLVANTTGRWPTAYAVQLLMPTACWALLDTNAPDIVDQCETQSSTIN